MPTTRKHKKASKKPAKTSRRSSRPLVKKTVAKQTGPAKTPTRQSPILSVQLTGRSVLPTLTVTENRVFSIELDSISGETTIGDLIVAFPRTRDVLMKHGLRFDVEEAGYLYMTLNVFSAIHNVTSSNLIQELDIASKEPPEQPATAIRALAAPTLT